MIKLEGRVLLFDEINRSSDKFPKNCEIIIPKKIPLTWNFEHNKPIGFAIPFKDNNGIYATAETFSNEYINVKDIRDILTDGKIGVGGYYKLGETHYEGKLLIIDEATLVEIGLTLAPVRDEYYFKIMHPDYFWTDSLDVDTYFKHRHGVKELKTFSEVVHVVLEECMNKIKEE